MNSIIFDFCYYCSYFALPLVLYNLYTTYFEAPCARKRDVIYIIKKIFAKKAVIKLKDKLKLSLKNTSLEELDGIKDITDDKYSDSLILLGADQDGNTLTIKITLTANITTQAYICLRLQNGDVYTLPEENNDLHQLSFSQWKHHNLLVETLQPFLRYRITFHGFLKNTRQDQKENVRCVQFSFIWASCSSPAFFPNDENTNLLAGAIAEEKWRSGNWIDFLGDEIGFSQFGVMKGLVRCESFTDEIELNLNSCRKRRWGTSEQYAIDKTLNVFITTKIGTIIDIGVQSLIKGCTRLKYGYVRFSDGKSYNVQDLEHFLDNVGVHTNLPNSFTLRIKVNNEVLGFYINVEKNFLVTQEHKKSGYIYENVPGRIVLSTDTGRCVIESWCNSHCCEENAENVSKISSYQLKDQPIPKLLVTKLSEEYCKSTNLTGGKGSSLGLLTSLQSSFSVPEGFVVTTHAFEEQILSNFNLRKAVDLLEDICYGKTKGDLQDACTQTVKLFSTEKITEKIISAIMNILLEFKENEINRWAVRSSAVGEDSEELSAAGQNETFLGCTSQEDIIKSIAACWGSLYTFQSVQYRRQHGIPVKSSMAVVVQKMVPADVAGILFTCEPSTGDPSKMIITSNYGLGESVVSGEADSDTITLNKNHVGEISITSHQIGKKETAILMAEQGVETTVTSSEKSGNLSLTDDQILHLGEVGVYLEKIVGEPRDIEWAFYKNHLYLLQARPITTLKSWSEYELTHEFDAPVISEASVFTVANVGEVCPGGLTCLSQSSVMFNMDKGYQKSLSGSYNPYISTCILSFNHQCMLDALGGIHRYPSKEVKIDAIVLDLAIFGHQVINDKINQMAINRFGHSSLVKLKLWCRTILMLWNIIPNVKKTQDLVRDFSIEISDRNSLIDIVNKIEKLSQQLILVCDLHCNVTSSSVFYQILALMILMENGKEITADHFKDITLMFSSNVDVISAQIPLLLSEIAEVIQKEGLSEKFVLLDAADGKYWLKTNCPKAFALLEFFLEKHGHRLYAEFELKEDPWSLNPASVIKMLQVSCRIGKSTSNKEPESVESVVSKLITPKKKLTKVLISFIIKKSRVAVGSREKTKSELIRSVGVLRTAYRALANRMVQEGFLPSKDLIYHLTQYEIRKLIETRNPALVIKAMRRERLYPKWKKVKLPEVMFGIPKPENANENKTIEGDITCTGSPVYSGEVQARGCVITSLEDINELQQGDILVTYSTDIAWSPYFPLVSGLVTELGGLVSHGTVVAREYGLPCVVGVKDATKIFKTGDILHLSGTNGTLTRTIKKD